MVHKEKSKYAGKIIRIKKEVKHPQISDFGGSYIRIEDWWDRLVSKSWGDCQGNPACIIYALRTVFSKMDIPRDDEVLYGKLNTLGHLVHIKELEIEQETL